MTDPTIALIGGETPLGRELRDVLASAGFGHSVQLIGAGEASGAILTEHVGEVTVITPLDEGRIADADFVLCAGDRASAQRVLTLAGDDVRIIDLAFGLEDDPRSRLRSPLTEVSAPDLPEGTIHAIAHPAAAALALVLLRVQSRLPLRRAIAHVFEPASERGMAGVNELQQQVSGLLSFRPLPRKIFDAQLGFNMLPRYGEDAPESLESVEARVERHLTTLVGSYAPLPSLRLIQAPVFHGHSYSLWLELDDAADVSALSEALASAQLEVRAADLDAPTNAGAAGQSGVIAGLVEPDRNAPNAFWVWAVSDNYRISADNALAVLRGLMEAR